MANPDSLFNQLLTGGIGAGVSGLFGLGSAALGNAANRRSQDRQNSFNADQAHLNRVFQSQEAQIARDWQEEQYLKYSSPSAMVNQYKDAGLNPALMYGANLQSGTGSSPSPSGSTASGSPLQSHIANMTGIMSDFLGLAQLKANIEKTESEADFNYAAAENSFASATNQRSQASLNHQQIKESKARLDKIIEETRSEKERQGAIVMQKILAREQAQTERGKQVNLHYEQLRNEFKEQFKEDFGYYPTDSLYGNLFGILTSGTRIAVDALGNFRSFIGNFFRNLNGSINQRSSDFYSQYK